MGIDKQIYAKVSFNGSSINALCGKCGGYLQIDSVNGKPSDYYKFCQKCGEEVRVFQMQFIQAKKEKDAFDKGLETGKRQGLDQNVRDDVKKVVGKELKSLIQEVIEDMIPDDQDIEDLADEVTSSAKKGIFAYIFRKRFGKK